MSVGGTGPAGLRRALRAHVETWRPYTLWYVGLVALAGAALVGGPHHPARLAAAWLAPTVAWVGGHYLGDYFDRELDAGSKPHRPIPSGRLSPGCARACGIGCFALLVVLAVLGGWGTLAAAVLGAFGIVAYSRWLKARGLAGNLIRGALGAIALVYGALAMGTSVSGRTVAALVALTCTFWLHDTTSNLVGTLRDIDGDRAGGYQTLPVRRGVRYAIHTVLGLYTATLAAALTGGLLSPRGSRPAYLLSLLVVAVLGVAALLPLVRHRPGTLVLIALRAHSVLVLERVLLASAAVGLGLGVGWQLGLVLPMLALTWWTQSVMRTRHELGTPAPAAETISSAGTRLEDVS